MLERAVREVDGRDHLGTGIIPVCRGWGDLRCGCGSVISFLIGFWIGDGNSLFRIIFFCGVMVVGGNRRIIIGLWIVFSGEWVRKSRQVPWGSGLQLHDVYLSFAFLLSVKKFHPIRCNISAGGQHYCHLPLMIQLGVGSRLLVHSDPHLVTCGIRGKIRRSRVGLT